MNAAFKFEIEYNATNQFSKDIEEGIFRLIKKRKIEKISDENVAKISWKVKDMPWADLERHSSHYVQGDNCGSGDCIWFTWLGFTSLIESFFDNCTSCEGTICACY